MQHRVLWRFERLLHVTISIPICIYRINTSQVFLLRCQSFFIFYFYFHFFLLTHPFVSREQSIFETLCVVSSQWRSTYVRAYFFFSFCFVLFFLPRATVDSFYILLSLFLGRWLTVLESYWFCFNRWWSTTYIHRVIFVGTISRLDPLSRPVSSRYDVQLSIESRGRRGGEVGRHNYS